MSAGEDLSSRYGDGKDTSAPARWIETGGAASARGGEHGHLLQAAVSSLARVACLALEGVLA